MVTAEQIAQYQAMMSAGGIVPGSMPPGLEAEILAAISAQGGSIYAPASGGSIMVDGMSMPAGSVDIIPAIGGAIGGAIAGPIGGAIGSAVGGAIAPSSGYVIDGVPIGGPLMAEPPAQMVAKSWTTKHYSETYSWFYMYHYRLLDGRVMCYHPHKREWHIWRPKKNVVISSNPKMSHILKLERLYDRTIRKLAKKSRHLKLAK